MTDSDSQKRQSVIDACLSMQSAGLNQGKSGNISVRHDDGFLITPSSRTYEILVPKDISFMHMDGNWTGPYPPSSEWRFHRDILANRPDVNAVVHAHPTCCTALAIHSMAIPAVHYMIAIFGGTNVRCAPYALYGTQELSDHALTALHDRKACLLAHHGMISVGSTLEKAIWRAEELETLAKQYHASLQIGAPPVLSARQMQEVAEKIAGYGQGE